MNNDTKMFQLKNHMVVGANGRQYRGAAKNWASGFIEDETVFTSSEMIAFITALDDVMGEYSIPTWSASRTVIGIDRRWHSNNNRFYIQKNLVKNSHAPFNYWWYTTYSSKRYKADTFEKCLSYMVEELVSYEDKRMAQRKRLWEAKTLELELNLEYIEETYKGGSNELR